MKKVFFLSDAHLGSLAIEHGRTQERRLVNFLDKIKHQADAIYLLGDMFDFWYEFKTVVPKGYTRFLGKLSELTDMGVEVHFFTGNHDMWTFGWLQKQTGVRVHRKPEVLTINGKRCMLAHGDGLVPSDIMKRYPKEIQRKLRRFIWLQRVFRNPVLQQLFRLVPPAWGDRLGYGWAKRSREKELAHPCGYKGENEEELVLFAKEHEKTEHLDYYIFGHRHIELDLQLATDARVIILGDMFKLFTYAAMNEKGEVIIN